MLLVLRHRWGEQAHLALSLPPQTPPRLCWEAANLWDFLSRVSSFDFYFFVCMLSLSHLCSANFDPCWWNRAIWSYISYSSCCFSTWKNGAEHLQCLFCGWCGHIQLQTPLQPPCVSALPDLLVQLLSNSSKKPAWKAVDLVFLENMVLREDVGDLKCLRVCKDKEQIKKKQNKQFNGDGAAAPVRRGCGRTSILSRCTRWFLTTEGHKNLTAEYWKIILLKVGNVLLTVNI